MGPHKTARGAAAMARPKGFEGIPAPYDKVKRACVPDALVQLRLKPSAPRCALGELATLSGWKYGETVKMLEEKRKVASKEFYEEKKKAIVKKRAAVKKAMPEIAKLKSVLEPVGMMS